MNGKEIVYYINVHTCTNEPFSIPLPDIHSLTLLDFERLILGYCRRYSIQGFSGTGTTEKNNSDTDPNYGAKKFEICYLGTVVNRVSSSDNENGDNENDEAKSKVMLSTAIQQKSIPLQSFLITPSEQPQNEELFVIARKATDFYIRNEKTSKIFQELSQYRTEQFSKTTQRTQEKAKELDVHQPETSNEPTDTAATIDTQESPSTSNKLVFDSSTPSLERKFIHAIAEQLQLHHASSGPPNQRTLTVCYRKSVGKGNEKHSSKKQEKMNDKNKDDDNGEFTPLPPPIDVSAQVKKSHGSIPKGMSEVIDNFLYLGSGLDANDLSQLTGNEIGYILNCTLEWPVFHALPNHIIFKRIGLQDVSTTDIMTHFDQVFQFLDDIRQRKGKVLVHCTIGKSRSASLVLSYLMRAEKMNLEQAHSHLIARRSLIKPNDGFMRQLMKLEHDLFEGRFTNEQQRSTSLLWQFSEPEPPSVEELNRMRLEREESNRKINEQVQLLLADEELETLFQNDGDVPIGSFIQKVSRHVAPLMKTSDLPEKDFKKAVASRAKSWYQARTRQQQQ